MALIPETEGGIQMVAFNPRKFTNPDLLKTIAPNRLIAFLLPWKDYLAKRGLILTNGGIGGLDCERLAQILMKPDTAVPKGMVDALYYVHETSSDEDMDVLIDLAKSRRIDVTHDPKTSVSDVAIQVWLAAPELLRERHAETVAFRQKNFLYYGGAHGGKRSFPNLDEAARAAIKTTMDDWFEEHRRGRDCQLLLFPQERKVWILVRHGLPMRREASHGEDGASGTEVYRPQLHDVLIYDTATDEIAVHANTKGEIKLYLTTLGRLVFGDENYFPAIDKFSLQPLIDNGRDSVLCQDIDGLEQVRLVEYRRYWGGAQKEVEIRKASDIFEALRGREQRLGAGGRLVGAVFKVRFSDSAKERSVTIRPPGNAKYERNEDSELIEAWLQKRGFIRTPQPEDDDEEAPSAVLERA